jgi:hypothetical protein
MPAGLAKKEKNVSPSLFLQKKTRLQKKVFLLKQEKIRKMFQPETL